MANINKSPCTMSTKKRKAKAARLDDSSTHKHAKNDDGSDVGRDSTRNNGGKTKNDNMSNAAMEMLDTDDSSYSAEEGGLIVSVILRFTMDTIHHFQVESSDTIGKLKQQIQDELAIPVRQLELSWKDGPLEDDQTISSLGRPPIYLKNNFQVFLKYMTGENYTFNVSGTDSVLSFKDKINAITGVPVDQMRLIFNGKQLEDDHTLDEHRVKKESWIHMCLRLRGMISTFTSKNAEDPLTQYLLLSDQERTRATIPIAALHQKAKDEKASLESFRFEDEHAILNEKQIQWLNQFLDFLWLQNFGSVNHCDLRVRVSDECFIALLAPLDDDDDDASTSTSVLQKLKAQSKATGPSIALRMTTGPTNACINFHCDGSYATYTTQIALNDPSEYDGGRLCFFVNDKLHVLERPAGSIVEHPSQVLHGVTALTRGTRRSLFVVDRMNGLGEGGVVEVKMTDVDRFIKQK